MRIWLFHPLVFYPLIALLAGLVIVFSIRPQAWPHAPAPVSGAVAGDALLLQAQAFDAPAPGRDQYVTVTRDFLGRAQTLRIAQIPNAPATEGARILLSGQGARLISGRAVTVEITYRPVPLNAASGLAVSLVGARAPSWVTLPTPPQAGALRFTLPAQEGVRAIGLRALSENTDQPYGIEITRIRIAPAA